MSCFIQLIEYEFTVSLCLLLYICVCEYIYIYIYALSFCSHVNLDHSSLSPMTNVQGKMDIKSHYFRREAKLNESSQSSEARILSLMLIIQPLRLGNHHKLKGCTLKC